MFFAEDHLRITKVRTSDGITPILGPDEKPQKKIIHAPYNAVTKKAFEEQNLRLPNPLKMKIEVIKAYNPQAIHIQQQNDESELLKQQIASLQAENEKLKTEALLKNSAKENDTAGQIAASEEGKSNTKSSK